jgi:cell division transport system permease protein
MKLKETKISKLQLRSSYLTSIISIALVLFMLGLLGLLVLNAKKLSDYVKENIGFSVMLKEDAKEVDVIKLRKDLDAKKYVKSTEYIDKERAAKEWQAELGEDFVGFLGYNPLLASIEVHLSADYANNDSIAKIEKAFKTYPEIKEVIYQKSLVHLVNENVKRMSLIILIFSGLLFLIAIALINNTIRLSVYSRRFIINTMKLVGATRGFIRKPFLYKSALHGVYASIIALLLLTGLIYLAVKNQMDDIISFRDLDVILPVFGVVLLTGLVINLTSTFFAINKYLRLDEDDLYF